jgi:hypothetical protein
LVSFNVLILYAYMIKTLAQPGRSGNWSQTGIALLFLATGLWGILSLLLLHPVRGGKEAPWVKFFARWFYPAQGPLLIFLVAVLGREVFRDGLKVNTYLELVLAFWIAGMAGYFTLGKGKSIKAIPVTLFLLCMLCSFGPWGVISLPRTVQVRLLEKLMADNGFFRDGRFVPATPEQLYHMQNLTRIFGILSYLHEHGGFEVLRDRLPPGPLPYDVLTDKWRFAEFLGLYHKYREDYWTPPPPLPPKQDACSTYAFHRKFDGLIDIRGYSFFLEDYESSPRWCSGGARTLKPDTCRGLGKTDSLLIRVGDNTALLTLEGQTLSIPLEKAMAGLERGSPGTDKCNGNYSYQPFPAESTFILEGNNERMKVAMQVASMVWEKDSSSRRRLTSLKFDLLLGYK